MAIYITMGEAGETARTGCMPDTLPITPYYSTWERFEPVSIPSTKLDCYHHASLMFHFNVNQL